jgi:hypothetical protein
MLFFKAFHILDTGPLTGNFGVSPFQHQIDVGVG